MLVLSTATVAKLQEASNRQQNEKVTAGDKWQENDLLFPSTLGTPMDPSNMYKDFKANPSNWQIYRIFDFMISDTLLPP